MEPVAVYIHIPFCPSKCGYCDFNSYAMTGEIIERTTRAIVNEIERSAHRGRAAKTIYFGGGTPTFIPTEQLLSIFSAVIRVHPPVSDCEICSEANPGTVDREKFRIMREAGFNRISIGGQSFDNRELVRLERIHQSVDIERAIVSARDAGFDNINLDLMFALPGQSFRAWQKNLQHALDLELDHLSLYCLTIEPNTKFYRRWLKGELQLPEEEEQIAMYDYAIAEVESKGFRQYEISNFAKPGKECRHNLCYWRGEEYIAYGPGAVEQVGGVRWTHIKHPIRYCEAVEQGGDLSCEREILTEETRKEEAIMLGLRLNEGVALDKIHTPPNALNKLIEKGWIAREDGRIRLTKEGRHYCNRVIVEVL